jgi:hypothetical protein
MKMALLLTVTALPAAALAQPIAGQAITGRAITGTRLDIVATGEVNRIPDLAQIGAGVTILAPTASEAMAQNASRMQQVITALRRAGVAERDIQTSSIHLQPEYRYVENQSPVLTGYRAINEVSVRFRDIKKSGAIIDALVAEGANQINGPTFSIDNPEIALDEARRKAIASAQARAQLYAQAIGKRVGRILLIDESGNGPRQEKFLIAAAPARGADMAQTSIAPGEQTISATLFVSFELE